jgi:hypothetical protein
MTWNALRVALFVGSFYDFVLGLAITVGLQWLALLVPIPYPADPVYARLCGVLLMGLAVFNAAAGITLPSSIPSVHASIAIRTAGALFLLAAPVFDKGVAPFLAIFGALDGVFALWTLGTLRRALRSG